MRLMLGLTQPKYNNEWHGRYGGEIDKAITKLAEMGRWGAFTKRRLHKCYHETYTLGDRAGVRGEPSETT